MYSRKNLIPGKLYYEVENNQYFITQDCVGVVWYQTVKEAEEDTGAIFYSVIQVEELEP